MYIYQNIYTYIYIYLSLSVVLLSLSLNDFASTTTYVLFSPTNLLHVSPKDAIITWMSDYELICTCIL